MTNIQNQKLKTYRYLIDLSNKHIRGLKNYWFYRGLVLCRYGRLYATNDYVLVSIDFPELEHVADYEWMQLAEYQTLTGEPLDMPEFEPCEKKNMRDMVFEDLFIHPTSFHYDPSVSYNPQLVKLCLKPFEIWGINPGISLRDAALEFTGHDENVSIRALMMGW